MPNLGFVVVGDAEVGKTAMLTCYGTGQYRNEYIATVAQSFNIRVDIFDERVEINANRKVEVDIHDTGGLDQHADCRRHLYNRADLFIICFSLVEKSTFLHVQQMWIPELERLRPSIKYMIVGTKADLRTDSPYHVKHSEGAKLAKQLGCPYLECSVVTQRGVKTVFDKAIRVALDIEDPKEDKVNLLSCCFKGK